jgi:MarR family transcriptional regulator, 2-MHQ and catechol-resistance regulon repressor
LGFLMNDKPTLRPAERRALRAYVKLLRASETVHAEATKSLIEEDLTPSQFAVLEALYHVGPLCLTELAKKILKSGGNLTMVVDNLEKRGLAVRSPVAKDRRFVEASITKEGMELISRIFPPHAAKITEIMSRLSPTEQETLESLCRKLGRGSE